MSTKSDHRSTAQEKQQKWMGICLLRWEETNAQVIHRSLNTWKSVFNVKKWFFLRWSGLMDASYSHTTKLTTQNVNKEVSWNWKGNKILKTLYKAVSFHLTRGDQIIHSDSSLSVNLSKFRIIMEKHLWVYLLAFLQRFTEEGRSSGNWMSPSPSLGFLHWFKIKRQKVCQYLSFSKSLVLALQDASIMPLLPQYRHSYHHTTTKECANC